MITLYGVIKVGRKQQDVKEILFNHQFETMCGQISRFMQTFDIVLLYAAPLRPDTDLRCTKK